jgi:hypothetical protein
MLPDLIAATSIPSSLTLPSGLSIDDPYGRLLRFSREEYEYYDGIPDLEPHRIVPIDVLATWSVNSNLYVMRLAVKIKDPATKMRGVHRALAERCDSVLARVPPDADLLTFDPEFRVLGNLLLQAIEVPGVGIAVATKVLHRKRPNFIPMLDYVIIKNYLDPQEIAALKNPRNWNDTELIVSLALTAIAAFRSDLESCRGAIEILGHALAGESFLLSPVRILEILIWTNRRRLYLQ